MAIINNNPQQNQQLQPQGSQKPKGTGFTNLQQIIQANRANRLGQTIGQGVQRQTQNVRSGIQTAQQQFGQGLQKSKQQLEQDRATAQQTLGQIAQNYSNEPQQVQTQAVSESPTFATVEEGLAWREANPQFFQDQPQQQQAAPVESSLNLPSNFAQTFQRLGRADYSGPTELENYGTLRARAQSAEALGQAAIDPNARRGLLQKFVGGPVYTQGQQRLDDILLGQTAGKDLSLARRTTQGLERAASSAQQQAVTAADLQRQEAQRAAQQVRADVSGATQGLEQSLQQRLSQAASTNQELFNRLRSQALAGNLQGQDLETAKNMLGFQDTKFITGQDVAEALGTFDPTQITKSSVARQADLARARALEQISQNVGQVYSSGLQEDQVGTFNERTGFSPQGELISRAQAERSAGYTKELSPVQTQIENQQRALDALNKYRSDVQKYNELSRMYGLGGERFGQSQSAEDQAFMRDMATRSEENIREALTADPELRARIDQLRQSNVKTYGPGLFGGGGSYLPSYYESADAATLADLYGGLTSRQAASRAALEQLRDQYNYYGLEGRPKQEGQIKSPTVTSRDFERYVAPQPIGGINLGGTW